MFGLIAVARVAAADDQACHAATKALFEAQHYAGMWRLRDLHDAALRACPQRDARTAIETAFNTISHGIEADPCRAAFAAMDNSLYDKNARPGALREALGDLKQDCDERSRQIAFDRWRAAIDRLAADEKQREQEEEQARREATEAQQRASAARADQARAGWCQSTIQALTDYKSKAPLCDPQPPPARARCWLVNAYGNSSSVWPPSRTLGSGKVSIDVCGAEAVSVATELATHEQATRELLQAYAAAESEAAKAPETIRANAAAELCEYFREIDEVDAYAARQARVDRDSGTVNATDRRAISEKRIHLEDAIQAAARRFRAAGGRDSDASRTNSTFWCAQPTPAAVRDRLIGAMLVKLPQPITLRSSRPARPPLEENDLVGRWTGMVTTTRNIPADYEAGTQATTATSITSDSLEIVRRGDHVAIIGDPSPLQLSRGERGALIDRNGETGIVRTFSWADGGQLRVESTLSGHFGGSSVGLYSRSP